MIHADAVISPLLADVVAGVPQQERHVSEEDSRKFWQQRSGCKGTRPLLSIR
jgi:hypothetical protein